VSNFNSEVAPLRTYDLLVCVLWTADNLQGPTAAKSSLKPPVFSWSPQ
jgi:hypothetical protein